MEVSKAVCQMINWKANKTNKPTYISSTTLNHKLTLMLSISSMQHTYGDNKIHKNTRAHSLKHYNHNNNTRIKIILCTVQIQQCGKTQQKPLLLQENSTHI